MASHRCPCSPDCAMSKALSSIGGRWKLPIICSLTADGSNRYNELLKKIHGISNTMLSQTLKEMEADGLVVRKEYVEVPIRVEYSLTEKAKRLAPILQELIRWSESE